MNVSDIAGRGMQERNPDFDLNLAPIIDCLTVLITFMLASASFLAVGLLDASAPTVGPSQAGMQPASVMISVKLNSQNYIDVQVSGKRALVRRIEPGMGRELDTNALTSVMSDIKRDYPEYNHVILTPLDDVSYVQVVKAMEAIRGQIPSILLGGF